MFSWALIVDRWIDPEAKIEVSLPTEFGRSLLIEGVNGVRGVRGAIDFIGGAIGVNGVSGVKFKEEEVEEDIEELREENGDEVDRVVGAVVEISFDKIGFSFLIVVVFDIVVGVGVTVGIVGIVMLEEVINDDKEDEDEDEEEEEEVLLASWIRFSCSDFIVEFKYKLLCNDAMDGLIVVVLVVLVVVELGVVAVVGGETTDEVASSLLVLFRVEEDKIDGNEEDNEDANVDDREDNVEAFKALVKAVVNVDAFNAEGFKVEVNNGARFTILAADSDDAKEAEVIVDVSELISVDNNEGSFGKIGVGVDDDDTWGKAVEAIVDDVEGKEVDDNKDEDDKDIVSLEVEDEVEVDNDDNDDEDNDDDEGVADVDADTDESLVKLNKEVLSNVFSNWLATAVLVFVSVLVSVFIFDDVDVVGEIVSKER